MPDADPAVSSSTVQEPEGVAEPEALWSDYPLDDLLIRHESRTVYEVVRRIKNGQFVLDPDFQREFIWRKDQQSKLIESVILRIPLPVLYLAEDSEGRMIVVDGLQRLSTFDLFLRDKLALRDIALDEFNGKKFSDLPSKLQNRIEDCNLIIYTMDSKVPDRAKLDIFDRVNSGVPLSRQQMRNCLFMGNGTRFLRDAVKSKMFQMATGRSLNYKTMRDREFVNRFCAFKLLGSDQYRGSMDDFLAKTLRNMNSMDDDQLAKLSKDLHIGLKNNFTVFRENAFRRFSPERKGRSVLNASLWDVMSTGLSCYDKHTIVAKKKRLQHSMRALLKDDGFVKSITYATNDTKQVLYRFDSTRVMLKETLG